jgi:hypothetical protein
LGKLTIVVLVFKINSEIGRILAVYYKIYMNKNKAYVRFEFNMRISAAISAANMSYHFMIIIQVMRFPVYDRKVFKGIYSIIAYVCIDE